MSTTQIERANDGITVERICSFINKIILHEIQKIFFNIFRIVMFMIIPMMEPYKSKLVTHIRDSRIYFFFQNRYVGMVKRGFFANKILIRNLWTVNLLKHEFTIYVKYFCIYWTKDKNKKLFEKLYLKKNNSIPMIYMSECQQIHNKSFSDFSKNKRRF